MPGPYVKTRAAPSSFRLLGHRCSLLVCFLHVQARDVRRCSSSWLASPHTTTSICSDCFPPWCGAILRDCRPQHRMARYKDVRGIASFRFQHGMKISRMHAAWLLRSAKLYGFQPQPRRSLLDPSTPLHVHLLSSLAVRAWRIDGQAHRHVTDT
ncbi:hypothetical protein C8Q70DRAFT_703683 [Cubamyces menziesii]|nr:hypothetical protein C8Q70DRAFT_703683 [Cubamyces menziesii]